MTWHVDDTSSMNRRPRIISREARDVHTTSTNTQSQGDRADPHTCVHTQNDACPHTHANILTHTRPHRRWKNVTSSSSYRCVHLWHSTTQHSAIQNEGYTQRKNNENILTKTMTMTMTTLTENVSNNCQSSGPVRVSDGVMTPRTRHRKSGKMMFGSKVSRVTVRRQCVEMNAKFTKKRND